MALICLVDLWNSKAFYSRMAYYEETLKDSQSPEAMGFRCPLCKLQSGAHEHLFFGCYFASNVWQGVLQAAELPDVPPVWSDIMDWIIPMAKKNNVTSIVGRLIVAATAYYLLQDVIRGSMGRKQGRLKR